MSELRYGVDKETQGYQEIRFQLAQNVICQVLHAQPDIDVEPAWERMWADSYLARQVCEFCATHKDPCYEDEREVRAFGYPAERAESRVLTGIASRKMVRFAPSGKRYIAFGEQWTPGIEPTRIIVGEKAPRDVATLKAMFTKAPAIAFAHMPIA